MTWKERRNVTILLSIAGALFLALLIVFGMIYRQGREEALAGKDAATGEILSDATSCAMCRRLIINAGLKKVVIRTSPTAYTSVDVQDWVEEE